MNSFFGVVLQKLLEATCIKLKTNEGFERRKGKLRTISAKMCSKSLKLKLNENKVGHK